MDSSHRRNQDCGIETFIGDGTALMSNSRFPKSNYHLQLLLVRVILKQVVRGITAAGFMVDVSFRGIHASCVLTPHRNNLP